MVFSIWISFCLNQKKSSICPCFILFDSTNVSRNQKFIYRKNKRENFLIRRISKSSNKRKKSVCKFRIDETKNDVNVLADCTMSKSNKRNIHTKFHETDKSMYARFRMCASVYELPRTQYKHIACGKKTVLPLSYDNTYIHNYCDECVEVRLLNRIFFLYIYRWVFAAVIQFVIETQGYSRTLTVQRFSSPRWN